MVGRGSLMILLELLGVSSWKSRYVQVNQDIKLSELRELSNGCDVILHKEGVRFRFIARERIA